MNSNYMEKEKQARREYVDSDEEVDDKVCLFSA